MPSSLSHSPASVEKPRRAPENINFDGTLSPDYWWNYAYTLEHGIVHQLQAGALQLNELLDPKIKKNAKNKIGAKAEMPKPEWSSLAVLRFLLIANVVVESDEDGKRAVEMNPPGKLQDWIKARGIIHPEQLVAIEQYAHTLRIADLVRMIELQHYNQRFISQPNVHQLHLGNNTDNCAMALLFHREFVVDRKKRTYKSVEHYPASLAVVSNDPHMEADANRVMQVADPHMQLQLGQAPPAEFFTPDEDNNLPPVYSWLTMPYLPPLNAAQLQNFAPTVEGITNPATGLDIFASIHDDVRKNDWLERIKTLLRLDKIAHERGWSDIKLNFMLVHRDGFTIKRVNSLWEIADMKDKSLFLDNNQLLAWLKANHGQLTTSVQMPLDCGCNAVFTAHVPSATEARLQKARLTNVNPERALRVR